MFQYRFERCRRAADPILEEEEEDRISLGGRRCGGGGGDSGRGRPREKANPACPRRRPRCSSRKNNCPFLPSLLPSLRRASSPLVEFPMRMRTNHTCTTVTVLTGFPNYDDSSYGEVIAPFFSRVEM